MPDINFTLIKLHDFKGGLHLSRGRRNSYSESQSVLHSDTLKSAIFVCALQLYGSEIDKSFLERFRISSAFPYTRQDGKDIFFFPKPNIRLDLELKDKDGSKLRDGEKILKKLEYVDKELFESIINGKKIKLTNKVQVAKSYAGLSLTTAPKVYENDTFQHVAVTRSGEADGLTYYVDKRYFHPDAGLFFLMKTDDSKIHEQVCAALRLLADSGLGTDRNNGNGFFTFKGKEGVDVLSDFSIQAPDDATYDLSLSLYIPTDQEEMGDLNQARYTMIKRGGYIANPQNTEHLTLRKRSVYMFEEGSLFPGSTRRKGTIVNLRPNANDLEKVNIEKVIHDIYRDGRALFIPCKIQDI